MPRDTMFFCPICSQTFSEEIDKYDHVLSHQETRQAIEQTLDNYPKIKELVGTQGSSFFNSGRETHQFLGVVLNGNAGQYSAKLQRLELMLETYSSDMNNTTAVRTKARIDFFSFFSEMELLHGIVQTFSEFPQIPWGRNAQDVDFILPNANLAIELKTPIGGLQPLSTYVTARDNQTQLVPRRERLKLLAIDTTFTYPDFPITSGGLDRILTGIQIESTAWNCLMTFSTFNQKSDVFFKSDVAETDKDMIKQLKERMSILWDD